jgi:hypothetical protein
VPGGIAKALVRETGATTLRRALMGIVKDIDISEDVGKM